MEIIVNRFFQHFETLRHDSLKARFRRQRLVTCLDTLIQDLILDEEYDTHSVIRVAVQGIIEYHVNTRKRNGNICLEGKHHDVLYIAVKACYDWKLQDIGTISQLLDQIYLCEGTFERILLGSLFSCTAPYFISGWKSDFANQEENTKAVVYFLDCANNARLKYAHENYNQLLRFIDIPIHSCGNFSCVMISTMMRKPEQLLMFLRYGALVNPNCNKDIDENIFEIILGCLITCSEANLTKRSNLVYILQILLRCTDKIVLKKNSASLTDAVTLKYFDLVHNKILPLNRCGFVPAELKHLSRLVIRQRLWENYQLPNGIQKMPIPNKLKQYVDIMED